MVIVVNGHINLDWPIVTFIRLILKDNLNVL